MRPRFRKTHAVREPEAADAKTRSISAVNSSLFVPEWAKVGASSLHAVRTDSTAVLRSGRGKTCCTEMRPRSLRSGKNWSGE